MENLEKLAKLVRYYSVQMTSSAGSGHLTSSLSATDLMTTLFFGGFFRYDIRNPDFPENDRIIFSKGHATPLFYSLWAAAGAIDKDDLLTYRKFGSKLEGHPTNEFKFTEAPTGSLGQGLSIGIGEALAAKMDNQNYRTYVLLGDSEMSEGQIWEAIQIASFYKLNNLIGIIDVNRLGQSGETMEGWDVKDYQRKISAFGWETILIDGHNLNEISQALSTARSSHDRPVMIIAKTIKGKGLKEFENKPGFHAKTIPYEKMGEALKELGEVETSIKGVIAKPVGLREENYASLKRQISHVAEYNLAKEYSTRKAYGQSLIEIFSSTPNLVVLDGEVSNSTYSEIFKEKYPEKFFEMFIAEQNMVSVAVGLSKREKIPFVSTFAAFFSRAHDQIRMASFAKANIKFVGSHGGVSIGEDGASQMGLEDIAMFRALDESVVLYPADAISVQKMTNLIAKHKGIAYMRTTRKDLPVIYDKNDDFKIGGLNVIKSSNKDKVVVIGAGITLHEAIKAHDELKEEGISIKVVDLYSIKPIDSATLEKIASEVEKIIVVEDHFKEGGIFEAVCSVLISLNVKVYGLNVSKTPRSGKPEDLLNYEEIDANSIINKVKEII